MKYCDLLICPNQIQQQNACLDNGYAKYWKIHEGDNKMTRNKSNYKMKNKKQHISIFKNIYIYIFFVLN
jgi:hypothetical protein